MIKTKEELANHLIKKTFDKNHIKILQLCLNACNLTTIFERTGLSKPLLSYYINGNLKGTGLVEYGLIERTYKSNGVADLYVTSKLGKDLLKVLK